jgi:tRNA pseudouridine-54 N-methylase
VTLGRDDERARRIGLNEAVFREVNERLEELAGKFESETGRLDLICECGNSDCEERLRMRREDYERVRADALLFVLVPGHEQPDVEEIVEHNDGYDVVRKQTGTPAEIARATAPQ